VKSALLGYHNERRWVRHVHADAELLGMFPDMHTQSSYHKRLKAAEPLCHMLARSQGRHKVREILLSRNNRGEPN
jgi:hypothetical protein